MRLRRKKGQEDEPDLRVPEDQEFADSDEGADAPDESELQEKVDESVPEDVPEKPKRGVFRRRRKKGQVEPS